MHKNCAQRALINNQFHYNCTNNMLSWNQDAAVLRPRTRDVNEIVYVVVALLEKAKLSGGLAPNCDSHVNKQRRAGYIKYHWTDIGCSNVLAPVT